MAVFQFSALSDGQSLAFNPNADVLNFDQTTVASADLRVTQVGSNIRVDVVSGPQTGKDVTLQNVSPLQLATTNVTFADGSRLLFGDNSTAQNDNLANSLTGTAGRDLLQGFGGADTMSGGAGNDTYIVGTGDVLSDSGGIDTVVTDVSWTLGAGFENVQMIGTGNISATGNNDANLAIGNSGNNYFNMRAGNDTIQAGAGNDWIDMSAFGTSSYGNDFIDGGAGIDTVNFAISAGQQSGIAVDLTSGIIRGGGIGSAGSAFVTGIEHVIGAGFNDSMMGSAAAETLEGREGNDTLSGLGGSDTLIGGTGQDNFLFETSAGAANADVIGDFVSTTDKLTFDNFVFTGVGPTGNFDAGDARFASGAGLTSGRDASDRLIYNTTTGQLFYDADGNGAGASQLVATLQGAPALAATDIAVVGNDANTNQGTPGDDHVIGTEGNDSLAGLAGNDEMDGLGGDDTLDGGDGDDTLDGNAGADVIRGGDGNDTLLHRSLGSSQDSPDTLDGGLGNDTYDVRTGVGFEGDVFPLHPFVVEDAGGVDTLLTNHNLILPDGIENATLDERAGGITGNALDNMITANSSDAFGGSVIDGGDGNDTVLGGQSSDIVFFRAGSGNYGNDSVDGGAGGIDRLSFDGTRSAVTVDMRNGIATGGGINGSGSVHFTGLDGIIGSDFDDLIIARDGANILFNGEVFVLGVEVQGGRGNDTLIGGAANDFLFEAFDDDGDDSLSGGGGDDQMSGGTGDDTLEGGAGNDNLSGDTGSNILDGGDGNDTLNAFMGSNTIRGGAGVDTVQATGIINLAAGTVQGHPGQGNATLTGVENVQGSDLSDDITGNDLANELQGFSGNDTIHGGGGDDTIESGFGSPGGKAELHGEAGSDLIDATGESAVLSGGTGNDTLLSSRGIDTFVFAEAPGSANADIIRRFDGDDIQLDGRFFTEIGPSGRFAPDDSRFFVESDLVPFDPPATAPRPGPEDRVIYNSSTGKLFYDPDGTGAEARQLIATLQSPASQLQAMQVTVVNGSAPTGGQRITGTAGNDSLTGTNGNDTLDGLGGVDTMNGMLGNDTYVVTAGDVLRDSGGIDTVLTEVNWTLGADFENLTMTGTGNLSVTGNNGDNAVTGNSGSNYFNLRAGDDFIQAGAGNDWIDMSAFGTSSYGEDTIDGGAGVDTVNFAISSGQQSAITVMLATGNIFGGGLGGSGSAHVTSVERVIGAGFNDFMIGSAAAETLEGREGNDTLSGMGGNDTLAGGTGADSFVFAAAPGAGNVDLITDFVSGTDKAAFDNSVFTALGADGNFAAGDARFAAGAGFTSGHDASDRIVYNTTTGQLFYDADGSGAGAAQLVAAFQGVPAIAATDITVL